MTLSLLNPNHNASLAAKSSLLRHRVVTIHRNATTVVAPPQHSCGANRPTSDKLELDNTRDESPLPAGDVGDAA